MAKEKKISEEKIQRILEDQNEQTLEQRHAEIVTALEAIKPQPIDFSPLAIGMENIDNSVKAIKAVDTKTIVTEINKTIREEVAKMTSTIVSAIRANRYESMDIIKDHNGIKQVKLNPIKGN